MGLGRFELPTSPLSAVRSSQLSYKPAAARPLWGGQYTRPVRCGHLAGTGNLVRLLGGQDEVPSGLVEPWSGPLRRPDAVTHDAGDDEQKRCHLAGPDHAGPLHQYLCQRRPDPGD